MHFWRRAAHHASGRQRSLPVGARADTTPLCLKAIGLELPHMRGAEIWQRLDVHHGDACLYKATPQQATLPDPTPRPLPEHRQLLRMARHGRKYVGRCKRWPFHFYSVKLPNKGLVLSCSSLSRLTCVLWLDLYDPLPYPPIFHLLCSDAVQHPLTKQVLWKTHAVWTLACLWPTYAQYVEQTDCGCGVRVTVRF